MMEQVGTNYTEKPIRNLAESLFFEKVENSDRKRLSVFGGFVYIFACVSFLCDICKYSLVNSKEK